MLSCKTVLLKIKSLSKSSIFVYYFFKKIYNEIKYCSANGWNFKIKKFVYQLPSHLQNRKKSRYPQ